MKNYIYLTSFIALLITTISCGGDSKKETLDNTPPISVTVNAIQDTTNNPFLNVSGKIQSVQSADLSTRMMGFVNKVHVKVGDKVKGKVVVGFERRICKCRLAGARDVLSQQPCLNLQPPEALCDKSSRESGRGHAVGRPVAAPGIRGHPGAPGLAGPEMPYGSKGAGRLEGRQAGDVLRVRNHRPAKVFTGFSKG